MRRLRLSTLLLLIAVAALLLALIVQHDRASRRIAELETVSGPTWEMISKIRMYEHDIKKLKKKVSELQSKQDQDQDL